MDQKALQLAARFSLPPNSLGYCGKNTAPAKFIDCVINGNCADVTDELRKFIVLNPYLETLTNITGLDAFSYPVIEAYWIGNDELKKTKQEDYHLLLENFAKQGVPVWLVADLKKNVPTRFIPTHLWQVLHVGVGRASGSVPYNLKTINNCMIRWGKVTTIDKERMAVNLNSLSKNKTGYSLTVSSQTFAYRSGFLPKVAAEDTVAIHWRQVVKKLTKTEVSNLEFWTNEVITTQKH